jgi:Lecithin retinol acyltransferase
MVAVLRPVSRSFVPRLRLRALHLDTLLRTAESAPAEEGAGVVVSRGVSARRYRDAMETGGVRAGLHLASQLTHIITGATSQERDRAVERAASRIGERRYSLTANNCEHFANWCATGVAISHQVMEAVKTVVQVMVAVARRVPGRDGGPGHRH